MITTAEKTVLVIECPGCGKALQETVARLVSVNRLACRFCGHWIDLKSPDFAVPINKAAQECERADALLSKPDKI